MTILVPRSASITVDGDAVSIVEGTVTLDERTTYAVADITLPLNATTSEIDPRAGIRSVITAEANGGAPRTFDLGVRERTIDHAAKTVSLRLASDEELLADWVNFEDVTDALDHQASISDIVEMVFDEVTTLPVGTRLELAYSPNDDFKVSFDSENLFPNPGAETGVHGLTAHDVTLGWSNLWAATETYSFLLTAPTSADSYAYADLLAMGCSKNEDYTASASVFINTPLSGSVGSLRRQIAVIVTTSTGPLVFASSVTPNSTGVARLAVEFHIPANALSAAVFFFNGHSVGNIWYDDIRVSPGFGIRDRDFFRLDGQLPDDDFYSYEWDDTPGNSVSRRTAFNPVPAESLIWRAGVSAWDFLLPITNAMQLRLFCDEQRKWRLVEADYTVAGDIEATASTAARGDDTITRAGDLWADGVLVRYTWTDRYGNVHVKTDTAGVEGKVSVVEFDSAYPGPGAAAAILARMQGQGRSQTVGDNLIDYAATPGMGATIALPGTPDQIGRLVSVVFDLHRGRMDLEARGLTDAP